VGRGRRASPEAVAKKTAERAAKAARRAGKTPLPIVPAPTVPPQ